MVVEMYFVQFDGTFYGPYVTLMEAIDIREQMGKGAKIVCFAGHYVD